MSFFRLLTLAAWLGCGVGIAAAASPLPVSRASADAAAVVEGFDLERVVELAPGIPLNFTVYGSPRAAVTLSIEGADHLVDLAETEPGIYDGTYVIAARDRIRPDSRVVATLQRNGEVVRSTLDEPLLLERGAVPWAEASPAPPPVPIAVAPSSDGAPRAPTLRAGALVPIQAPAPAAPARAACGDCALVESIRVESAPARGGLGAVAGAIAGAIVGDNLAEAHRRHVMQVLGAIGGALLGREIELRQAPSPAYNVVLRLPDGSALERRYEQPPPFRVGDHVSLSGHGTRDARTAIF